MEQSNKNQKEELLKYFDYLTRLAGAKCGSRSDAEDIVSDTMLAAFSYIHRGGVIEYPKTWLANTLMHKYNNMLRRKYREPTVVNYDAMPDIADESEADSAYYASEEAANVRGELIYMAKINREVLIRHYFSRESVAEIARALDIPEGTVQSRLSAGRGQIRKGLEQMNNTGNTEIDNKELNNLPGSLNISYSGGLGKDSRPMSLVWSDLIAQNLLILAYDKPLTSSELARAIGIPTVYIEPILNRLTDGELMVRTDGDKYYTDFIIYKPEDTLSRLEPQLEFVRTHFDALWGVMTELTDGIGRLDYAASLNERQLKKLERFAIIKSLQDFVVEGGEKLYGKSDWHRSRRDGGSWIAMSWAYPAGFNFNSDAMKRYNSYSYLCGHRTNGGSCDFFGASYLMLHEFDTTLYDAPHRYNIGGDYFSEIRSLLWSVYKGMSPRDTGVSDAIIESIAGYEEAGLFSRESGALTVDIPIMSVAVYAELTELMKKASDRLIELMKKASDRLIELLNADYIDFLRGTKIILPPHLKSVSEFFTYRTSTDCIIMGTVREAYDRGLHLKGVDYCCPPVTLVYESAE